MVWAELSQQFGCGPVGRDVVIDVCVDGESPADVLSHSVFACRRPDLPTLSSFTRLTFVFRSARFRTQSHHWRSCALWRDRGKEWITLVLLVGYLPRNLWLNFNLFLSYSLSIT